MRGCIVYERRLGPTATGPPLVDYDESITLGVKKSASAYIASATRTTVHEHGGLAVGITALLIVNGVLAVQRQKPVIVRLQRRIEGT